jgi:hypothetical protein
LHFFQPENFDFHTHENIFTENMTLMSHIFIKNSASLQQVPAGSQNIKAFLRFSTFTSGLQPNSVKSSCGW